MDEVIKNYQKKTWQWVQVDVEKFPNITEKYQVRGIPSLLVFKNGE
jgi:thioredoxin-like negative regulator of GroEL